MVGDAAREARAHARSGARLIVRDRAMGVVTVLRALLVHWVLMAVAFAITAWLLNGMDVSGGLFAYLWIAAIFGVVNAIIGTFSGSHAPPDDHHARPVRGRRECLAAQHHRRPHRSPDDRRILVDRDLGSLILAFVSVCLQAFANAYLKPDVPA